MADAATGRPVVFGRGWPFRPEYSSNSTRRPMLFDWTEDPDEATVDIVVHNGGNVGSGADSDRRRIGWLAESPAILEWQGVSRTIRENIESIAGDYEVILSSDRALCALHPNVVYHPSGSNLPWIPEASYGLCLKTRMCSMFASAKTMVDGHLIRHRWAERLKDRIDVFGGAAGTKRLGLPIDHPDKREGLVPYRFHVCMENVRTDLHYTEKITDCFATGTVPIYWGSDRIGELFDPAGIIRLDDDFDPAMLTVELYQSMMPAIRRNLEIVRRLHGADDLLYLRYLAPGADGSSGPFDADGWRSIGLAGAMTATHLRRSPDELLAAARSPKVVVDDIVEIPRDRVTTRELITSSTRPQIPTMPRESVDWFPPLQQATLMHVPDCFIGDNVLFDEHRWYGLGNWWAGRQHQYTDLAEVRHIDAGLLVSGWGGDAFQHFIGDAVPRLACALALLESPGFEHVSIVSHYEEASTAQWFFEQLGLTHRVVQKPRHPGAGFVVHADVAMVVEFDPAPIDWGFVPRGCLLPVQERLAVLEGPEANTILYLARERRRAVANEAVLLDRLATEATRVGLRLDVRRSGSDQAASRDQFRQARLVVGPHGGAFGNLVFVRPGTPVIEFHPVVERFRAGEETRSIYWGLAQGASLDYWAIEPADFGFETPSMTVDVDQVIDVVRTVLG